MNAQTQVPFVDTNIIPDRNVGIGSLLWDLQNPRDPADRPPLLHGKFAFIDVGVSRANVSIALKALLTRDFEMDVHYVATERLEAVPYANVIPLGESAERIRGCLSRMISSTAATREVNDWHFVVDRKERVSSVAYSYDLHGNEVWESYFMGRPFMYAGERVEFSDAKLDEMLAPEVTNIEAMIDSSQPASSWDEYWVERNPLEAGLAEFGITLQKTDVPQRIKDRQNVLFLGNVLNHYPQDERARELVRMAATMTAGDIVIVQVDEVETSFIEVLHVQRDGSRKTLERVMWIDTQTLEVQKRVRGTDSFRHIRLTAAIEQIVSRLSEHDPKALSRLFKTFFRALPVEKTLRIAIREALRRLPSDGGPKGVPAFKDLEAGFVNQ